MSTKLSTTIALAALLLIGGLWACSPSRAYASDISPNVDDFESYSSGWTGLGPFAVWPTENGANCYGGSGRCISAVSGTKWMYHSAGTAVSEGGFTFDYWSNTGGTTVLLLCDLTAGSNDCNSGTNSRWEVGYQNGDVVLPHDSTWHVVTVFWRNGASTKENCILFDDQDKSHCSWNSTNMAPSAMPNSWAANSVSFYNGGSGQFYIDNLRDPTAPPPPDTSTRIASTTPAASALIASSTASTFGAGGYVNSNDYVSGNTYYSFCYLKAGAQVGSDIFAPALAVQQGGCLQPDVRLAITAATTFNVSTTTDTSSLIGAYVLKSKITVPFFSFFGIAVGSRTLVSTSTVFTVGTTTAADALALGRLAYLEGLNVATSSTAFSGDVCNPVSGSFSATYCVLGLFVPDGVQISQLSDDFSSILSVGPWGFVGTTALILGGHYYTDTTTLPSISFNVADLHTAAALSNTSVSLSPWGVMASGSVLSSATSPKDGKSFRDITETGWDMFVLLMFALAIFNELAGVGGKAVSAD